jgi:glutamate N-acetyltransferase/amino-acid N-acetyltransferase
MKLPKGYRYASAYAGIRYQRKDDLALIVSDPEASAAAMFTTNQVQAAPVRLGRKHLAKSGGVVKAVLINAGNANCATRTGDKVALECSRSLARALKIPAVRVIPSSTGVIGVELPPELITAKIPELIEGLSNKRFPDLADAIMTTDTVPKTASAEVELSGGMACIAGVTKGSGMIHPNMATTLAFVMTDAAIGPSHLRQILIPAVENSFHRLTVDGDTSTNDTVLVLANGASGAAVTNARERKVFGQALGTVLEDLARKIARDGEGARKLITIEVTGMRSDRDAGRVARSIANSPLVKTAVAGADPNWGRILVAAGYAGVAFDPGKVDIFLQGVQVCGAGLAARFSEKAMEKKLARSECEIRFVIRGRGKGQARFWTCDLTEGYVHINADYRT